MLLVSLNPDKWVGFKTFGYSFKVHEQASHTSVSFLCRETNIINIDAGMDEHWSKLPYLTQDAVFPLIEELIVFSLLPICNTTIIFR